MRQIKFRGKRVDNGEFVFGDFIHGVGSKAGNSYILPVTHIYPKGCNELDGWQVIPETVGQFTGLRDKAGEQCYEGDQAIINGELCTVQFDSYYICGWEFKAKVGCYSFNNSCRNFNNTGCQDFEIIGNIHHSKNNS